MEQTTPDRLELIVPVDSIDFYNNQFAKNGKRHGLPLLKP